MSGSESKPLRAPMTGLNVGSGGVVGVDSTVPSPRFLYGLPWVGGPSYIRFLLHHNSRCD